MLRPIRNRYVKPRLIGVEVSSSGTASVSNGCKAEVSSVTDNGTGDTSLGLYEPYRRNPVVVATPFVAVGAGAIGNVTGATGSALRVVSNTSAGSGADGKSHVLALGWDSTILNRTHSYVKTARYKSRLTGFSSVSGALVEGKFRATLSGPTSSAYTYALKNPGGEVPIVVGTVQGSTAGVVCVDSSALNSVVVKTYNAAGTLTDYDHNLLVLTKEGTFDLGRNKALLECPQKEPNLLAFKITVSGGTPTLAIGGELATVSDNGTGDYTITLTEPASKRALHAVATADGSYICTIAAATASTIQVKTFTNAGVAADVGSLYVLALHYDTLEQY